MSLEIDLLTFPINLWSNQWIIDKCIFTIGKHTFQFIIEWKRGLLASILVNPYKVLIINFCGILVELIRRKHKQICEHLYRAANVVLNTLCNSFKKIYKHTSKAFNKFTLFGGTKKQNQGDDNQIADMV